MEGRERVELKEGGIQRKQGRWRFFKTKECVLRNLWERIIIKRVSSPGMQNSDQVDAFGIPGGRSVKTEQKKRDQLYIWSKNTIYVHPNANSFIY